MTRTLTAVALLASALTLSACGGTDSTSSVSAPPKPAAVKQATETARSVCGTVPRKKFAADFGMATTSPTLLAHRYARGYDERMRSQVEDACLSAMTR